MNDLKTVTMNESKFNDLIRYIEDERAECIEKDVEPSDDLKDAYEAISEIFKQLHPNSVQLPSEDARIIRDMFSEMISFDESEEHEEPPEYVYRLETQLSTLIGDTKNAHMSWEESK